MNGYKIVIREFKNAAKEDRIEVLYGDDGRMVFSCIAALDHFIYELRRAAFDYKINHSKQQPQPRRAPQRGC